jgi:hypothetical protein
VNHSALGILGLYLFLGGCLGIAIDRWQMKKDVPYGSVPSGIPLSVIRMAMLVVMMLGGIPMILYIEVEDFLFGLTWAWRCRRFNSLVRKIEQELQCKEGSMGRLDPQMFKNKREKRNDD